MHESQTHEQNVSVLIIGAGPVGLTVANLLGLYGISTLLIERNEHAYPFPRAISIDDEGLRICQALGLRAEVLEHVLLDMDALYLSHGQPLVRVRPVDQRNGYPWISTFDQPRLERALLTGLRRFPSVSVRFGCTLETFSHTQQGVHAQLHTVNGEPFSVRCDYLLACDGGKSTIRQALDIRMRGSTFPQRWLVVDHVDAEDDPPHCITFFCDIERPMVQVYAPHGARRWEFMLLPGEHEEHLLKTETIRALIQHTSSMPGETSLRQAIYTFHASHATAFSLGRIFLLGDAAHLLPPFGGQGMNCGLRDAHNLAWKLAMVLRGQASQALLATYQRERMPHALQMIRFSAFMGRVVMPTNRFIASLRDTVLRALLLVPPIARLLTEMRIKPISRYKTGFTFKSRDRFCRQRTGQLLPQPYVTAEHGDMMLLDDVLGPGFTLLRLHEHPESAFQSMYEEFWRAYGVRLVCLVPATVSYSKEQSTTSHIVSVVDKEGKLSQFVHGKQDIAMLVRPDRYLAAIFPIAEEEVVIEWLQKYLCELSEGEVVDAGR